MLALVVAAGCGAGGVVEPPFVVYVVEFWGLLVGGGGVGGGRGRGGLPGAQKLPERLVVVSVQTVVGVAVLRPERVVARVIWMLVQVVVVR